jgi:hypothetical protein
LSTFNNYKSQHELPHFQNIISKFNITSFGETWIGESTQDIVLPNFELVHSSSRKKHKKARRYSGGISIFAKNSITCHPVYCIFQLH